MTNPFGITEVDIPGALGAYEAGQTSRVNRLFRQQQLSALERQADREQGIRETLAGLAGGPGRAGGAAAAYATPTPASATPANPDSVVQPGEAQAPAAPARQTFRDAIPRLLALGMDPTQVHALAQLDDEQSASAVQRWQQVGPLYVAASRMPYEQRRAYIASVAPQLTQLGISPAEIQGFDPTDANLSSHIALGTTMAQALEPRLMTVEGEVVDQRALPQGAPGDPVVYRSQYIATPAGLAERPGGGVAHPVEPQTRQARNRQTGQIETLQRNELTGQWEPVASATQTGGQWPTPVLDDRPSTYPVRPPQQGGAGPQGPRTFR